MAQDWLMGLAGGALIGLAAALLRFGAGLVAGISGITYAAVLPADGQRGWRLAFLAGLCAGGIGAAAAIGGFATVPAEALGGTALVAAAGLLVGVGTALGNGCTSGHGVCGISRLSPRSIVATAVFMAFGVASATLLRPLLVGG